MVEHIEPGRVQWVDTEAGARIHFTAAFRWAEAAETALMRRLGAPCESRIYSGHGHILAGTAAWDAAQRIYRFLESNLKHSVKAASQLQ